MKNAFTAALLLLPVTAGGALIGWTIGRVQVAHEHSHPVENRSPARPEPPQVGSNAAEVLLEADAPPGPEPTAAPPAVEPSRPASPQRPSPAAPPMAPSSLPPPTPVTGSPPVAAPAKPRAAVLIVVSLASQRAFVFRNGEPWASTRVSTGKARKRTPVGRYTILEKQVRHRSRTYANAPMPYMQRLTWGGVALHAGHVPNFPASHGCIRLPWAFARRLYAITSTSTVVVVTDKRLPSSERAWRASHPQTAAAE